MRLLPLTVLMLLTAAPASSVSVTEALESNALGEYAREMRTLGGTVGGARTHGLRMAAARDLGLSYHDVFAVALWRRDVDRWLEQYQDGIGPPGSPPPLPSQIPDPPFVYRSAVCAGIASGASFCSSGPPMVSGGGVVVTVPEPTLPLLLGASALALLGLRRRAGLSRSR